MHRVGEKRKSQGSPSRGNISLEVPQQKRFCVRREDEDTITTTTTIIKRNGWLHGAINYCSGIIRNMFSIKSPELKPPRSDSTSPNTTNSSLLETSSNPLSNISWTSPSAPPTSSPPTSSSDECGGGRDGDGGGNGGGGCDRSGNGSRGGGGGRGGNGSRGGGGGGGDSRSGGCDRSGNGSTGGSDGGGGGRGGNDSRGYNGGGGGGGGGVEKALTSTPHPNDSLYRHPFLRASSLQTTEHKNIPHQRKKPAEMQVLKYKHSLEERKVYSRLLPHSFTLCNTTTTSAFSPRLENIGTFYSSPKNSPLSSGADVGAARDDTFSSDGDGDGGKSPSLSYFTPSSHHYNHHHHQQQHHQYDQARDSGASPLISNHHKPAGKVGPPPPPPPPPFSSSSREVSSQSSYWTRWMKDFKQDFRHLQEERQVVVEVARTKLHLRQKERMAIEDVRITKLRDSLSNTHLEHLEEDALSSPWNLSPDQRERVQVVLKRGNEQECVSEKYRIRVTRSDLRTLTGLVWLNDEVINFYFNLISECCLKDRGLKVHVFNSFFYTKLSQSGYSGVRRWTKKVDVFDQDLILLPVHLGMHWCLAAIDFNSQQFLYYDSLSGTNKICHSRLREYLQSESLDKRKVPLDLSEWTNETPRDVPRQTNSSDCGVFTCMYARHKAYRIPFTFSQDDMTDIRKLMIVEILEQRLVMT